MHCKIYARKPFFATARFTFASANGDGVSDPKNPRVFFKLAKNGKHIGRMQFEVSEKVLE